MVAVQAIIVGGAIVPAGVSGQALEAFAIDLAAVQTCAGAVAHISRLEQSVGAGRRSALASLCILPTGTRAVAFTVKSAAFGGAGHAIVEWITTGGQHAAG